MPLGEYRRKRLSGGTPEPIPDQDPHAGETEEGVFVVHAHAARRLHFDLRLESGGALLSFALPKGVSLDPEARLLAVRTEDHPLEYVDFEDVIPAGQYGGGAMIAWDRGLVRWLEIPAERQVQRGKLDFVLYGRKLRGRFSLIPLKDAPSYLLMKKKDAHARAGGAELDPRSVFSGLTYGELPTLRARARTLEEQAAGLLGARARSGEPALLARSPAPSEPQARAESQCDFVPAGAFRALLTRRGLVVRVDTERGASVAALFPDLVAALRHSIVGDFAVEALVWREAEPELRAPELPCQALVVDVLDLAGRDLTRVPVDVRRALAARMFPGAGIVRSMAAFPGIADNFMQHARDLAPAVLGVLARTSRSVSYFSVDESRPFAAPIAPQPLPRQEPARATGPRATGPRATGPRALVTSNRGKPFFPAVGLTKGDLLDYYDAIASMLLPHVRRRPVILERYPDGVDGKHFFQWRPPPSAPSWLGSVELPEHRAGHVRDAGKQARRAFLLEDRESLLYVVNLGCIPLHLLAFDPSAPDLCTFATLDFDVKQASLDMARPLVGALRRLLEHAELPAFLKTSGKTGLHVLLPLGAGIPFVAAEALVELLGRWLTALHPGEATREGLIDKRGRRVYIDTGQTGPIRAIAAPYSVRPVPDARISMPLPWSQLETLDPGRFTLATVPAQVAAEGDPWVAFRAQAPDLARALTRLQALAARQGLAIS